MRGFLPQAAAAVILVSLLLSRAATAQAPAVTVVTDGGSQYIFYRTSTPITAAEAAAKCAADGATLASFTSAEQVLQTIWSDQLVDAVGENTALLWTGLKITWSGNLYGSAGNRRMLRGNGHAATTPQLFASGYGYGITAATTLATADDDDDDDVTSLIDDLARQMDASTDFVVPTLTPNGSRRLPELLRLWLFQQHYAQQQHTRNRRHRNLLASAGPGDGSSPFLDNAKLTWADGSDASFILSNPSNLGFLACNRKKTSECCGAVFDIGPDPYPGSEFPTIFFYPCGSQRVSGATPPQGFICAAGPLVAELPKTLKSPRPSKAPLPSPSTLSSPLPGPAGKKCGPGSGPAVKATSHPCSKCKPNTFSSDGLKCRKCPPGTTSGRGASACE